MSNRLIYTIHYWPILPSLNRFIEKRHSIFAKHMTVSNVYKLQ